MINHDEAKRRHKAFQAQEREVSTWRCVGAVFNLTLCISGLILGGMLMVRRATEERWFDVVFLSPVLGGVCVLCAHAMVKQFAAEIRYQNSEMTAAQYLGEDAKPVPDKNPVVMAMVVLALLNFVCAFAIWPDYLSSGESDSPPPEELRYDGYK